MDEKSYWVYMLLCDNNTYYTGYTDNIEKRYQSHLNGTGGCKYTRSFKPIKLAQAWEIKEGKGRAMQLERLIKKLTRLEKDNLVNEPNLLMNKYN
ncbi:GIY-YIG nuclease family protein [Legionella bozemanae]|uniref:Nuclease n=1 Tax=Legionella bozemanae TaxID=447 RepID=A0A0W0REX6_LEGBO|nr:GIY-YIG nuclease family protein [Legionella bozemanae]KTC69543.1 nuclease [Legionella bozemanae]STP10059.1 GIY-YIG nuclease superfamily protein [Legionella bozemanae]